MRIGSGFDVHAFGRGDFVMLGGVRIAHTRGVIAHSDGDVMLHALCDALLGAAGLGDIGEHFPTTIRSGAGADSARFVRRVHGAACTSAALAVGNVDITRARRGAASWHRIATRSATNVAALLKIDPLERSTSRRRRPKAWDSSAVARASRAQATVLLLESGAMARAPQRDSST